MPATSTVSGGCWPAPPSPAAIVWRSSWRRGHRQAFRKTTRRFPRTSAHPRTRHLVLNPIVALAAERTATARSTFCVVQATDTVPLQPIVVGR